MLAIRMQRTGRKGHAMFRVVVQDSRLTPTSGKLVAQLGSYDPHTKAMVLDKEKAKFYLDHGAQPSDRVVRMFKSEGVKLPKWVVEPVKGDRSVRNAEKRRSTRPEEPTVAETAQVAPEEGEATATATEAPVEAQAETTEEVADTNSNEETPPPNEETEKPQETT